MIQVRKFGAEVKTLVPNPAAKGMSAAMVQLPSEFAATLSPEEIQRRFNGEPFVLDRPNMVVVLYFDAHSEMNEHPADEPILMMTMSGSGFVRLGGEQGETVAVNTGDAVMWEATVPHKVWTTDSPLQIVVFHYAKEAV